MTKAYIIMIRVDGGAFEHYTAFGNIFYTLAEAQVAFQNGRKEGVWGFGRMFIVEVYV